MTKNSLDLPQSFALRRACANDAEPIQKIVYAERLDPTQLYWSQFWVIECPEGLVACGQLRSYPWAQELSSLVVAPAWRGRGFGACLAKHLVQQASQPLYLTCATRLVPFYSRLGFIEIPLLALPCPLKLKFALVKLFTTLFLRHIAIMQYNYSINARRIP